MSKTNHTSKTNEFFRRLFGLWFDQAIVTLPILVVGLWITQADSVEAVLSRIFSALAVVVIPYAIATSFYEPFFLHQRGATPGKTLAGIKVTDQKGKHLSFGWSVFRAFIAKPISAAPLLAGIWIILTKHDDTTWHDQLTSSQIEITQTGSISKAALAWLLVTVVNMALLVMMFQAVWANFSA